MTVMVKILLNLYGGKSGLALKYSMIISRSQASNMSCRYSGEDGIICIHGGGSSIKFLQFIPSRKTKVQRHHIPHFLSSRFVNLARLLDTCQT